ncbi:MAG: hypothetical protein FWC64_02315 [Treponema sp.]|nr:hypothetical protein [Treponema sp.]
MKKMVTLALVAALAAGFSAAAFAQDAFPGGGQGFGPGQGFGGGGWGGRGGGGMMWRFMLDEDGSVLSREAFAGRLDQAVGIGLIAEWERDRMLAAFDWRQSRMAQDDAGPGVAPGSFGFCCDGFGAGFGRGRRGGGGGPRGGRW